MCVILGIVETYFLDGAAYSPLIASVSDPNLLDPSGEMFSGRRSRSPDESMYDQ